MSSRTRAQSIIELVVGLIVLVPIVLILIDIGTLFIGSAMNSDICREAARAAAAGAPNALSAGTPRERAEAVVDRKRAQCGGNVTIKSPILLWETVNPPVPSPPFGGPVDGEVVVQTTVTVRPPFLVGAVVPNGVDLKTTQTFPYTWIMPSDSLVGSPPPGGSTTTTTTTGGHRPLTTTGGQVPIP